MGSKLWRALRGPLVVLAITATIAVAVGVVAFRARSEENAEVVWLRDYVAWVDDVQDAIDSGSGPAASVCDDRPEPPSERVEPSVERARSACRRLAREPTSELALGEWDRAWYDLTLRLHLGRPLPRVETISDQSRVEVDLSELASRLAAANVDVRCWDEGEWPVVEAEWKLLFARPDFWIWGVAQPGPNWVHLAPHVCEPLTRFVHTAYAPFGTTDAVALAEALATFTHEARHIRHPYAREAVVECYGQQDVRKLVVAAGRTRAYADEMAANAWELAYRDNLAMYKTKDCRNGGPLDLRPRSEVWP